MQILGKVSLLRLYYGYLKFTTQILRKVLMQAFLRLQTGIGLALLLLLFIGSSDGIVASQRGAISEFQAVISCNQPVATTQSDSQCSKPKGF